MPSEKDKNLLKILGERHHNGTILTLSYLNRPKFNRPSLKPTKFPKKCKNWSSYRKKAITNTRDFCYILVRCMHIVTYFKNSDIDWTVTAETKTITRT